MHLVVIFENIGGYHAARLRAAQKACAARGWRFTAMQITNAQNEHPWGELDAEASSFSTITILPRANARGKLTEREMHASGARMAEVLDDLRPDAVAIPGWGFAYSRAALRWCRRRHALAILMSESKWDDEPRTVWKEFFKSHLYVKKFDGALVGAESHRDYLVKLGFPRGRIFTGYDVVDNDYFTRHADAARAQPSLARARQRMIPERPYFLAVTRLIPRKNVPYLIRAYVVYRAQAGGDPWDLVICGSGVDEAKLRDLISENKLEQCVHLPGFVSYRDIGDWYGLAGAFIHPPLQEQWGLVVNEAMAAALPVLVSDRCGCYRELVQPVASGFNPQDADELAALMSGLGNETDTAALGSIARAHLQKHFAPEHFAAGLLSATDAATTSNVLSL